MMNWEGKLYAFHWKYDRFIPPEKANGNRWVNYLFRQEGTDEWVAVRAFVKELRLPVGEYTLIFTRPYPPFE